MTKAFLKMLQYEARLYEKEREMIELFGEPSEPDVKRIGPVGGIMAWINPQGDAHAPD